MNRKNEIRLMAAMVFGIIVMLSWLTSVNAISQQANKVKSSASTSGALDSIIAQVNHEVITSSQLDARVRLVKQQMTQSRMAVPANNILRSQVLEQMIDESLQLQKAKELGLTVDDKMVDQAIAHIASSNHATVDDLKKMIASQGLTYPSYRETIRKQIIIGKLQQQAIGGSITLNKEEVTQELLHATSRPVASDYRVVDIVIPVTDNPSADQIAAAQKQVRMAASVLRKTRKTAPTPALFQAEGLTTVQINDLGWRSLNQLPDIFATPVQKLLPGQFSSAVRAPNGFHLLKLMATRATPGSAPPKMTFNQAQEMVYQRKFSEALATWLRLLRNSSYVKEM